jgi:osmotically-inducible protein OsmY
VSVNDYRINAQIRVILVRRGIDLSKIEYGVTNSVVYLRGSVRTFTIRQSSDPSRDRLEEIENMARLEKTIRAIPGVKDVIFQMDHLVKVGWRWKPR